MQVGESQCTDVKILQAVSDTLKEALGKKSHVALDSEGSQAYVIYDVTVVLRIR